MSPAASLLRAAVRLYQLFLSPFFAGSCRFEPSCSAYAMQALAQHGVVRGLWLTIRRLGRCHPWGGAGSDPVPTPHSPDCRAIAREGR